MCIYTCIHVYILMPPTSHSHLPQAPVVWHGARCQQARVRKKRALPRSHSHLGRLGSQLRGSWAASGRLLEAKLEDFAAILDGLGGQVGGLEANVGVSWRQLGRFW